jgi:hypothetical protein
MVARGKFSNAAIGTSFMCPKILVIDWVLSCLEGRREKFMDCQKKLAIEVRVGFLVFLETSDFLVVADGFWEAAGNL